MEPEPGEEREHGEVFIRFIDRMHDALASGLSEGQLSAVLGLTFAVWELYERLGPCESECRCREMLRVAARDLGLLEVKKKRSTRED